MAIAGFRLCQSQLEAEKSDEPAPPKFDATTGESNGTRLPVRSLMDSLARVLVRLGILTEDLDYHLIRASMVIIFLFFGYQKWFQYEADVLIPYITNGPITRLGQPDGISPSRMAEMLEVDKAGPIVRC
jgi:hypothetical protein